MHATETLPRRFPSQHLETTLSVFYMADSEQPDDKMKAIHQQRTEGGTTGYSSLLQMRPRSTDYGQLAGNRAEFFLVIT